jgi:hypothetical protein
MNSGQFDRNHQSASHNQRSRQEAYIDHTLHPITFADLVACKDWGVAFYIIK